MNSKKTPLRATSRPRWIHSPPNLARFLPIMMMPALLGLIAGCIPVDIPAGKEITYAMNDNIGVIFIHKKTRQYLAPLNPDGGFKKEDYYMPFYFNPSQFDEKILNSKGSVSIKLYGKISDAQADNSQLGTMTVKGR